MKAPLDLALAMFLLLISCTHTFYCSRYLLNSLQQIVRGSLQSSMKLDCYFYGNDWLLSYRLWVCIDMYDIIISTISKLNKNWKMKSQFTENFHKIYNCLIYHAKVLRQFLFTYLQKNNSTHTINTTHQCKTNNFLAKLYFMEHSLYFA